MSKKVRVNITVDKEKLDKVKSRLHLFGGKLSTLFNAYLDDFIESMDKNFSTASKDMAIKIKEMDERIKKIEKDIFKGKS